MQRKIEWFRRAILCAAIAASAAMVLVPPGTASAQSQEESKAAVADLKDSVHAARNVRDSAEPGLRGELQGWKDKVKALRASGAARDEIEKAQRYPASRAPGCGRRSSSLPMWGWSSPRCQGLRPLRLRTPPPMPNMTAPPGTGEITSRGLTGITSSVSRNPASPAIPVRPERGPGLYYQHRTAFCAYPFSSPSALPKRIP